MLKRNLLSLFLLCCVAIAAAQTNAIIAGEKGTATYVDWNPNQVVVCWPSPPSESCGSINDSIDLNQDSIIDFVLSTYHTGFQGLSYEFHYITPLNNNEVLTDSLAVFNPFQGNIIAWRVMPIDSGMTISNAGIDAPDSTVVQYIDSLGFPADSMYYFQRHYRFHNSTVSSSGYFFMDIPAVLYFNSLWNSNNNIPANNLFLGLRFYKGTDTLYAWIRTDYMEPRTYYDYAFTGKLSSIDDTHEMNEIELFPNPTQGIVKLKLPNATTCTIVLMDALGNEIKRFSTTGSTAIDCSDLTKGLYFLKITTEKGSVTKKLIY